MQPRSFGRGLVLASIERSGRLPRCQPVADLLDCGAQRGGIGWPFSEHHVGARRGVVDIRGFDTGLSAQYPLNTRRARSTGHALDREIEAGR